MTPIRTALAYSFLGANTATMIQFASTLIIVRLLTPEELGVYSVAAVFIGIAAILRDFGVVNYLIQASELSKDTLRAAFGLIILTATILGLLILACAGEVADFYRDPRVGDVLTILAINFFVTPLGSITLAIARRQMRFRALAIIKVVSICISVGVSIPLISNGFGPVGLAWGAVAGTIATFLMSLPLRTDDSPLLPTLRGSWEVASFGSISAGASILSQLNGSSSDIILGRLLGLESVGLFNRAESLTRFVNTGLSSAISPVLLPWLSQLKRDRQHPREAYRKVVERTTGITWPIFAVVAVFSDEVVLILFGEQWGQSAALVPYLCLAATIVSAYTVCSHLYFAAGKPSAALIVQSINLPVKVAAVILLAPYGILAIAAAWPLIAGVGAATHQFLIKRLAGITLSDTFSAFSKSAVLGLASLFTAYIAEKFLLSSFSPLASVGCGLTLAILMVTLASILVRHPLVGELRSLASKVRSSNR